MRSCRGCGTPIVPGRRERRQRVWCSETCRVRAFSAANPAYVERNRSRAAERYRAASAERQHASVCVVCGEAFTAKRRRMYCTTACSRRAYNIARRADGRAADIAANRRALEKGAKVSRARRLRVLERDAYVCQLCNLPTRRDAVYPAWDFAVVDHVVPLTDGGVHDVSNWQTAHSFCNTLKSDLCLDVFFLIFPDLTEVVRERLLLAA